jgi:hypothetical protein
MAFQGHGGFMVIDETKLYGKDPLIGWINGGYEGDIAHLCLLVSRPERLDIP